MAKKIPEALKGKKDENATETEAADVMKKKVKKKVRFSRENELIEFAKSPKIKGKSRRSMVVCKFRRSTDNVDNEKLFEKIVDNPSRVQKLTKVSAKENGGNVAQVKKSKGKSKETVEEDDVSEPQIRRRSKRNANKQSYC